MNKLFFLKVQIAQSIFYIQDLVLDLFGVLISANLKLFCKIFGIHSRYVFVTTEVHRCCEFSNIVHKTYNNTRVLRV